MAAEALEEEEEALEEEEVETEVEEEDFEEVEVVAAEDSGPLEVMVAFVDEVAAGGLLEAEEGSEGAKK